MELKMLLRTTNPQISMNLPGGSLTHLPLARGQQCPIAWRQRSYLI